MTPSTIGERITYARELRGMSQGDLARATEIAATQLSRYETGRAVPRKLALHRLAMALAVNWKWLDSGEGEIGEYGSTEGAGLSIWVDAELRDRITAYAYYNGLTLEEAVADILDDPLSVYSRDLLPKTPVEEEKLKQVLKAYGGKRPRLKVLASKLQVAPAGPPQAHGTKILEKVVKTMPAGPDDMGDVTNRVTEEYSVRHRNERNPAGKDRSIPVKVVKKRSFPERSDDS